MSVRISVIIPAFNEAETLPRTLAALEEGEATVSHETIVVDGGSRDETCAVAERAGARVVISPARGRWRQLNLGASEARGEILLFLHADTQLPVGALGKISEACRSSHVAGGGFVRVFDSPSRFLAFTCWLSGLRVRYSGIFLGDQAMFVRREVFEELGGFEEMDICEDLDFSLRLREAGQTVTLRPAVVSSARRFEALGPVRRTAIDLGITYHYLRERKKRRADAGGVASAGGRDARVDA